MQKHLQIHQHLQISFPFGKVSSDSAVFSDNEVLGVGLFLDDTLYVTDDADGVAGDDSSYTFVKVVSNFSILTDNDTIAFAGIKSEALGLADSGSGRSQGYCAFDYFAEDYVGSSWTF